MKGIDKFEDLIAWQKARDLTRAIYDVSKRGALSKDFGLAGQIQRAAVSTMANIAEGFERSRQREFHQFLSTAKASCAEVRSQAEEVGRIIGGLRASLGRDSKNKV